MRIQRNQPPYLGAMTWAQLSAITTAPTGTQALVTDWGQTFIFKSTGEWAPLGGSVLLSQNGAPVSVTGTTSPAQLLGFTIPAALMGLNGRLALELTGVLTGVSGSTVLSVSFGGTNVTTVNITNNVSVLHNSYIRNKNNAAQQAISTIGARGSDTVVVASTNSDRTINTAADVALSVFATPGGTGVTLQLNGYSMTLFK